MDLQSNQHDHILPYAREHYGRLCEKYGTSPTAEEIKALQRTIGAVSQGNSVVRRFEAAVLFFFQKSAVQFEQESLLIGWVYKDDGAKRQVWFNPSTRNRSSLCHRPGYHHNSLYKPEGSLCEEWHPVIFDIVNPDDNTTRALQYAYFKACIKILKATVPPPSIEGSLSTVHGSVSPSSIPINPIGLDAGINSEPQSASPSTGPGSLPIVDLTGSDGEVDIKPEARLAPVTVNHARSQSAQVEAKVQAFREKLGKKTVEELEQMLEKQLPSWIKKLAEEVLQKKMLEELELAESLLL